MRYFPVLSQLRGCASHVVLLEEPQVRGKYKGIEVVGKALRPSTGEWEIPPNPTKRRFVRATQLQASGPGIQTSLQISSVENRIYRDHVGAFPYTLVLFPEVLEEDSRTVRWVVVSGVQVLEEGHLVRL